MVAPTALSPAPPLSSSGPEATPLLILAGPTASGKSALGLALAERLGGEIVSCDSVAVYRGMDVGTAKPSAEDRARVPHHGLDLLDPDQPCTAGDYARFARESLAAIVARGRLPIVVGGTGLYLRALLEGLAPAPPRDEALRARLREREGRRAGSLHRLLGRLDARAATAIHAGDLPKLIRSLEVTLAARRPQSEQWAAGRDALRGFRVLALALDPPRAELRQRIDARAAAMFGGGLLEETAGLLARYGDAAALGSLGYAQARAVLGGKLSLAEGIAAAQTGHRQYSKRQATWFRHQGLAGQPYERLAHFGNEAETLEIALERARSQLCVRIF